MVTWKLLSRDESLECWNERLFRFEDFTYSQSFEWGEYRSNFGQRPYRWIATNLQGEAVTMCQGLLRSYPGKTGLLWVAGGPVGDLSSCGKDLMHTLQESTEMKRLYCRISPMRHYSAYDALILRGLGWKRPSASILSGMTMHYDSASDEQARVSFSTKNWRHNLRRSEKYGLSTSLWENPEIDTIYQLYTSMQDYKQLSQQYSKLEIEKIFNGFGKSIVLYRCDDESGNPVALRGCVILGKKAWDLFAATSVKGRKLYASYALFWRLMKHCHENGVVIYDMSGIDPFANPGVYDFKKGTGAKPVEYLGEWEWASSEWLRWGANWMIGRRAGRP